MIYNVLIYKNCKTWESHTDLCKGRKRNFFVIILEWTDHFIYYWWENIDQYISIYINAQFYSQQPNIHFKNI